MQTLGQRLRAEREKTGLSIAELAGRTRIRADYFQAIENDRPEAFPGQFFYRSFLRQYAELLNLPADVIQPAIQHSIEAEEHDAAARNLAAAENKPDVAPLPTGRTTDIRVEAQRWLIRLSGLAGVIVLCSLAYYAWTLWGQHWLEQALKPQPRQTVAAAPKHAPAPAPPVQQTPAPAPTQTPESGANAANPSAPAQQPPMQQTAQPRQNPAAPAPPAAIQPAAANASPAGTLVELQATGDCWVDLWRDGKHTSGEMLRAGDRRSIAPGGKVRIRIGSAGSLQVRAAGRNLGALGPVGQTRTLECGASDCAVATAKPPAPPVQP
jgi:cytoskeleton protein RodZ